MSMRLALVLTGVGLVGCGGAARLPRERLFALPKGRITVLGNRIFNDGNVFAELRYLHPKDDFRQSSEAHRGVAIYYHRYDKEVWVFPEEGWGVSEGDRSSYSLTDVQREWDTNGPERITLGGGAWGDATWKIKYCFDVEVSADGRSVHYTEDGVLFDSPRTYLVEYGVSQ